MVDPGNTTWIQEPANATLAGEVPCADEPIHMPGSVQPHGFLLGLDPESERVIFASENVEDFLGIPLKLLLGATLELFLERELLASVRILRCAIDPDGLVSYLGTFPVRGELFSVITHCVGGRRVLEFERQDRLVGLETMNAVITNFVGALSTLETEADLCQAITKQIQGLTGFDRVLLYCFDSAGHGTVLAEENNGVLPSYLDLRFPATDIPAQARALYVSNTVRIIPNANYAAVPIRGLPGEAPERLDMSLCVLRSVSPVHLEYMRNMGTSSSMSVSIISEGRLWGLISAHHAQACVVPYLVRSACDMLTKMVAAHLTAFRSASKFRTMVHFHEVQRRMLTQIAAENNYRSAIATQMASLMEVTAAEGAVLAVDGHFDRIGETPEVDVLRPLIEWLDSRSGLELYETNHLSSELPWTAGLAAVASGLLAIRISDVRRQYVLWFRPEVVRTVRWAGEPLKQVDETMHLHPRASFEVWKETLRGQSTPWSSVEIESARDFRGALTTITLRRAEEAAALSEARFNKLTHALPMKIFAVTDDGQLSYVNDRWKNEGHGEQGLWYERAGLIADDTARSAASWKRAVETETEFEEEVRLVTPRSGAECWNLVRLVPFRREGAEVAGWIGSCIDLTERKQRETALRIAEKLTLTGRMTSFLAHEINNPLEAIVNILYLLRKGLPQDAATDKYFETADDELERISGIVKQTLRWGSENSDKKSWTTAGSLFDDVLRLFVAKIRNRGVHVSIEGGMEVPLCGIVGQLRQIVAHLVSNAIDAVPVGGKVWLKAEQLQNEVELLVGDDGVGMSTVEQHSLFRPFYSTKGDLGNGLGLYISHEIAERHQGRILIESVGGHGTTVRLRLPIGPNPLLMSPESK